MEGAPKSTPIFTRKNSTFFVVKVNTSGFWDQRKAIYSSLTDRLPGRLPRGGGTQTAHRTGAFSSISHFMAEHSMRNEVIHRSCQIRSFMLHVYWVLCKDYCFDVVWKVGSSRWELGERMEEQQKNSRMSSQFREQAGGRLELAGAGVGWHPHHSEPCRRKGVSWCWCHGSGGVQNTARDGSWENYVLFLFLQKRVSPHFFSFILLPYSTSQFLFPPFLQVPLLISHLPQDLLLLHFP